MKTYRPIEFRHICAIARALIVQTPTMTDADWKESVKATCRNQGWEIPSSEQLSRAMGAVERALVQTTGIQRQPAASSPVPAASDRCWTAADYRALALTVKQILARGATAAPGNVTPIKRTVLDIDEGAALDQFYLEAAIDRLAALRRFAEIAIVRPADWDFAAVRAEQRNTPLRAEECFACRARGFELIWHHVVQVQHGGSNYLRNRVALCEACHQDVHPWLTPVARRGAGWWSVAEVARTADASRLLATALSGIHKKGAADVR